MNLNIYYTKISRIRRLCSTVGSQGEILSLMSGGFLIQLSVSYLSIKRGLKTHFIFFNLGGIAHEIGVKQVSWYLWNKLASSHRVSFITIPFEDVGRQIFKDISPFLYGSYVKKTYDNCGSTSCKRYED